MAMRIKLKIPVEKKIWIEKNNTDILQDIPVPVLLPACANPTTKTKINYKFRWLRYLA
jgi:hypothetical protein